MISALSALKFSAAQFEPDVHTLIAQKEFERIPIVWLNPLQQGKVIYRNDAVALFKQVFDKLIKST